MSINYQLLIHQLYIINNIMSYLKFFTSLVTNYCRCFMVSSMVSTHIEPVNKNPVILTVQNNDQILSTTDYNNF
jgi:hypothetical protein